MSISQGKLELLDQFPCQSIFCVAARESRHNFKRDQYQHYNVTCIHQHGREKFNAIATNGMGADWC